MDKKILVVFAHPRLEDSRIHRKLLAAIADLPFVTICDLYELYPDFMIDVTEEQHRLKEADIVVWQHPVYWYSCPPLLKQWIDLVLQFNWAYGPKGFEVAGKKVLSVVSTGGRAEAYGPEGHNRFTIREYLLPFDQTAHLCRMHYLDPFVVHGTHRLTDEQVDFKALEYRNLIEKLAQKPEVESVNVEGGQDGR